MSVTFDISPEKEASKTRFLYRQLFIAPAAIPKDVDLSGKTVIVTGSNTGLGLECARQFLDLRVSKLIIAVRSETKGEEARAILLSGRDIPDDTIEVWPLDYLSYDSITAFAERAGSLQRLDIVVLNAGINRFEWEINSSTSHEMNVQVNYLSNALLAILILPILKAKNPGIPKGRLVIVSSDTASRAKINVPDPQPILSLLDDATTFTITNQYPVSKLLGQFFMVELAKIVPPSVAIVNLVNPCLCQSSLSRDADGTILGYIVHLFLRILGRSAAAGGNSIIDAAVGHDERVHGQYVEDGKLTPMAPIVYKPEGERLAKKLWKETMEELSFAGVEEIIKSLVK